MHHLLVDFDLVESLVFFKMTVRKGYVLKSEDWKYTTARNWHNGEDKVISLDLEQL